jgi:ubiquinone/menaquinone biosynthesis C-methylase UbiE
MNSTDRKKLIQRYYSMRAKDYDCQKRRTWKSTQGFSIEITDELLNALKGFENKPVLEVGIGSGRNALPLLEKVKPRFVGLDLSREMLKLARAKMAPSKKDFDLILGDAEHLPFAGKAFNAVVCMSTMHYFASQEKVLLEFSRILSRKGILAYGDLTVHESDKQGFFEALERMLSKAHAGYHKPAEIRQMLEANGFCVSRMKTFAYRKSCKALMEDKGQYFNIKSETLQEFIHNAPIDAKEQYALTDTELTQFYIVVTASQ